MKIIAGSLTPDSVEFEVNGEFTNPVWLLMRDVMVYQEPVFYPDNCSRELFSGVEIVGPAKNSLGGDGATGEWSAQAHGPPDTVLNQRMLDWASATGTDCVLCTDAKYSS